MWWFIVGRLDYFFYCRDRPGSGALRASLAEAHWSFMDAYSAGMIARGPTLADLMKRGYWERLIACGPLLSDDGVGWAGGAWMIELEARADVEAMLAEDPQGRAGLYERREVHRWQFGGRR